MQLLYTALIVTALVATYTTPAKAHAEPSSCSVSTGTSGYKQVFVYHVKDNENLWLTVDGVTTKRIYRGLTQTTTSGSVKVNAADGWAQICSG